MNHNIHLEYWIWPVWHSIWVMITFLIINLVIINKVTLALGLGKLGYSAACDPGSFIRLTWEIPLYSLPWEPITLIFRGYDPYIGGLNLHFSWFWGPRVVRYREPSKFLNLLEGLASFFLRKAAKGWAYLSCTESIFTACRCAQGHRGQPMQDMTGLTRLGRFFCFEALAHVLGIQNLQRIANMAKYDKYRKTNSLNVEIERHWQTFLLGCGLA